MAATERVTVLLVEDAPEERALLAESLCTAGYTVAEAADGPSAVRVLDQHLAAGDLGLVLLDMRLPQGGGVGVLRYMAALGRTVPVVAISTSQARLIAALAARAQAAVAKPFDVDALLAVVARHCPPPSTYGFGR